MESNRVPSLQELCERKLCEQMLAFKDTAEQFGDMEQHEQRFLFRTLRKEKRKLQKQVRMLKRYHEKRPWVDQNLAKNLRAPTLDENNVEYYLEQLPTIQRWHYEFPGPDHQRPVPAGVQRVMSDEDDFVFYPNKSGHNSQLSLRGCPPFEGPKPWVERKCFKHFISSQLLFYRICTVFGMPLSNSLQDRSPQWSKVSGWEVRLRLNDGFSDLCLQDDSGKASVWFDGAAEGRDEALKILNHLTGLVWCLQRR